MKTVFLKCKHSVFFDFQLSNYSPNCGWARSWWNDRSFPRTNGTIKNDPIIPKKNERLERVLKILERLVKERNGTGIA